MDLSGIKGIRKSEVLRYPASSGHYPFLSTIAQNFPARILDGVGAPMVNLLDSRPHV